MILDLVSQSNRQLVDFFDISSGVFDQIVQVAQLEESVRVNT